MDSVFEGYIEQLFHEFALDTRWIANETRSAELAIIISYPVFVSGTSRILDSNP